MCIAAAQQAAVPWPAQAAATSTDCYAVFASRRGTGSLNKPLRHADSRKQRQNNVDAEQSSGLLPGRTRLPADTHKEAGQGQNSDAEAVPPQVFTVSHAAGQHLVV